MPGFRGNATFPEVRPFPDRIPGPLPAGGWVSSSHEARAGTGVAMPGNLGTRGMMGSRHRTRPRPVGPAPHSLRSPHRREPGPGGQVKGPRRLRDAASARAHGHSDAREPLPDPIIPRVPRLPRRPEVATPVPARASCEDAKVGGAGQGPKLAP